MATNTSLLESGRYREVVESSNIVVQVHSQTFYPAPQSVPSLLNAIPPHAQSYSALTFFFSVLTSSPPTAAPGPSSNFLALTSKASIIIPATLGATALLNAA